MILPTGVAEDDCSFSLSPCVFSLPFFGILSFVYFPTVRGGVEIDPIFHYKEFSSKDPPSGSAFVRAARLSTFFFPVLHLSHLRPPLRATGKYPQ